MLTDTVSGLMTEEGDDITIWLRCRNCHLCGEYGPDEAVNQESPIRCDCCGRILEYAYITIIPKEEQR